MLDVQPLISVIINCYNGEKYLREAVDSVLAQSYPNWEIVFWDNQSTDSSADIIRSYEDSRIRYFYAPEHTTLGQARNLAVEQANGEWIAFLDCDDLWLPFKLERQAYIITEERGDLGLVYGQCRYLIENSGTGTQLGRMLKTQDNGGVAGNLPEGDIFTDMLRKNFVTLVSAMVRRSAYWAVGGIDSTLRQSEDYDLFLKVSKEFKARAIQEVICRYRIHGSNQTHSQLWNNYMETITIISRYLPLSEAKTGVIIHQTYLSSVEIREGKIFHGMVRLIKYGNPLLFLSRSASYIMRHFVNLFRS